MKIFHVRAKLAPRGGNNFYRDKRERVAATVCGAAVTDHDVRFHDKAVSWEDWVSCSDCLKLRGGK